MRDDWGPWNGTKQDGNQNPNQQNPNQQNSNHWMSPSQLQQQSEGYPPGHPPQGGGFPPGYRPPGSGMATASLVLGILSLVFWILYIGYIIMAPLAIIFGAVAKRQGNLSGFATAGIVMGIVSIAGAILFWVACGAFMCAIWDEVMLEMMEMGI